MRLAGAILILVTACQSQPNPQTLDVALAPKVEADPGAAEPSAFGQPVGQASKVSIPWQQFFKPPPLATERSELLKKIKPSKRTSEPKTLLEAARAQAKLSAVNARRFSNLADEGVVTERQRDDYVTLAEKDEAHLQSTIADADSIKAQIATRQSDLKRSRDQYAAAAADLRRAQAQLAAARQDESAAKARVLTARAGKVRAEGVLRQALTAPTQVAISKSNRASARSQISEARAKVSEQASILGNLFVVSPITGMIVTRIRDHGEVVTAGSPILEVVNLDRLYLKAYVPENQIGRVRLGLQAQVYVDAYPGQPFDATVRYISSTAEFTPKEVQTPDERVKLVYAAKLYLDKNPGHRLTPGMPADAIIRWKEGVGWERPRY